MLQIATKEYETLEVSDIELNLNKPLTTLEAFNKIEKEYKDIDKYYIIGADNLNKIISSKDCNILAEKYKYIVIQRNSLDCMKLMEENEILQSNHRNFQTMKNARHSNTSSTEVRKRILHEQENIEELIQRDVLLYIKTNKLYEQIF